MLAGLSPNSPAVAIGCAAAFSAGVRLRPQVSLGIMAETVAAFLIAALVTGAPTGALLGFPFAFAGLWSVSLTRREYLVRAQQAEHTLAETRRARQAEMQAAALAERARIARDIHDVLAHSNQLSSLVGQYRAAGDLAVDFTVTGEPRPLSEAASLVAYRTAQEGLTNARKHAPGQPVALSLGFQAAQITVTVANPMRPVSEAGPQVVLMDLNMPRCDGVEATRRIRASHPQTQVVVLTTYSDDESIIGALQAGALGYLTKDATRAEIGRAVLAAAAGQDPVGGPPGERDLADRPRSPPYCGLSRPVDWPTSIKCPSGSRI